MRSGSPRLYTGVTIRTRAPASSEQAVTAQRVDPDTDRRGPLVSSLGDSGFDAFFGQVEAPLCRSLVAYLGYDRGREAFAEAMVYAWEHRQDLAALRNPVAYLFRVGQSRTRPPRKRLLPHKPVEPIPDIEPGLEAALRSLSPKQRTCLVLCVGFEWTQTEVADLLGISKSTVQRHLERGLAKVQSRLGSADDWA